MLPNILFAGASGYGNIGDDAYRLLFSQYLKDYFNCIFDSPYPNQHLMDLSEIIVIGGGGVIYDNNTGHFDYMSKYMEHSVKKKKPLIFSSCGVQLVGFKAGMDKNQILNLAKTQLKKWIPYLNRAELITVRSEMDREIINVISSNKNVFYYPDFVYSFFYSFANLITSYSLIEPNAYVVIPTKSGSKTPEFARELNECKKDKSKRIYFVAFSRDDYDVCDRLASENNSHFSSYTRKYNSVLDACSVVHDAYKIITNRYHGFVMAKSCGNQNIKLIDGRYKSVVENKNSDILSSMNHGTKLFLKLKELCQ